MFTAWHRKNTKQLLNPISFILCQSRAKENEKTAEILLTSLDQIRQRLPDPPWLEKQTEGDILPPLLLWPWRIIAQSRRLWNKAQAQGCIWMLIIFPCIWTVHKINSEPSAGLDSIAFLQMGKMEHREVKWRVQGHTRIKNKIWMQVWLQVQRSSYTPYHESSMHTSVCIYTHANLHKQTHNSP